MEIKYCPKCHQEAYRIIEKEDSIKIMQGRIVILNLNRESSVSMSLSCPHGHPVKLEIKPKEVEHAGQKN